MTSPQTESQRAARWSLIAPVAIVFFGLVVWLALTSRELPSRIDAPRASNEPSVSWPQAGGATQPRPAMAASPSRAAPAPTSVPEPTTPTREEPVPVPPTSVDLSAVDAYMATRPVDPRMTSDVQRLLLARLAEQQLVADTATECRGSICKLRIEVADLRQASKLLELAPSSEVQFTYEVTTADGKVAATVYRTASRLTFAQILASDQKRGLDVPRTPVR